LLFLAPHDDDPVIGIGMTIRRAVQEGVPVRVVIVSDGRNGYVSEAQRSNIVELRKRETIASFEKLGVPESSISWLGFPDGGLQGFLGRRTVRAGEPEFSTGQTGLEEAFVQVLREPINRRPVTRVFAPSVSDYHLDHVAVGKEVPISIFHATGGIWPELGPALPAAPYLYYYPVYCALPKDEPANLLLRGSAEDFRAKLAAIGEYRSQGQIAALVKQIESRGPVEVLREVTFDLFDLEACLPDFIAQDYRPS